AQLEQPVARFGFRNHLVGADEDVAGVGLLDDDWRGPALVDELQDVKPVGAAQDRAHVADPHALYRLEEQRRQAARLAPAEQAALEAFRGVRESGRYLAEIRTLLDLRQGLLGPRLALLDLLRARLLGHAH